MNITRNDKGFTLVEALVALMILTIGILTLITMQTTSIKGNAKARNLTTAATWNQDKIESLLGCLRGSVSPPYNCNTVDCTRCHQNGICQDIEGTEQSPDGFYTITWSFGDDILVEDPVQALREVTVTVDRSDFGAQRSVSFNYYRHYKQ